MRAIFDNDFGGDPDGLFQLAHHVLSPSVEIRGVIGSFFTPGSFFGAPHAAARAREAAEELLAVMGAAGDFPVQAGADSGLPGLETPVRSEGAEAMVREVMRSDARLPLYVACGGGLTDVASAFLLEPKIAGRLTLIWIGGPEYPGAAPPPPGAPEPEYNLGIDIQAAQVVFNRSHIPLWQVPRDAYRQALVSSAELQLRVKRQGRIGRYLADKIEEAVKTARTSGLELGETYVLGDSPLVLLTALSSAFDRDPSSSRFVLTPVPSINDAGAYEKNPSGRLIRVYTRLLFEDFFSKLSLAHTRG